MTFRHLRWLLAAYAILLLASHVVRRLEPPPPPAPDDRTVELAAVDGERTLDRTVRVAYLDEGPRTGPAILLLHGSPGTKENFFRMLPPLAGRYRTIAPDLPGFGGSEHDLPDYSLRAHAIYMKELLDRLEVERVHVVGYSLGGGVALELAERLAPERCASITLLSATAVQELELLGDYRMNRLVHGAQLAALWLLREGTPHFGALDRVLLGVPYARNFYDSDQRPLRGILERLDLPVLILHGSDDFLVPPAAAREHHRIVPQSELRMIEGGGHVMLFDARQGRELARLVSELVDRVERGEAPRRADAPAERVARARVRFDPSTIPPATGAGLLAIGFLIVVATLVSEDLTCIGVGLMVGQGRIGFVAGTLACIVGIFVGDLLLYLAGRKLGRPALARAPLRWWIGEEQVDSASAWFRRRGPVVILLSRFMPGARLPTYFAAGTLRTGFARFAIYFLLAVALWTPALVGLAWWLGDTAFSTFEAFRRHTLWALPLLALWILVMVKVVLPLFGHRGRRLWAGRLLRWRRWEFWPPWLFYPPVVLRALQLGLRHRSPLAFTAANPAMPASGFIDESKADILDGLTRDPANAPRVARYRRLPADGPLAARADALERFLADEGLDYPAVLKPDAGQRGAGVHIVRDAAEARDALAAAHGTVLAQEYVPGAEYGLFWYRPPGEASGRLFAITEKVFPEVVGDGERSVERLILDDPRAVAMYRHYVAVQGAAAARIPAPGERVRLVELGTHCLGAIFLDGARLRTDALERAVDEVSLRYDGFHFGRYDVRTEDEEALRRGEFKVLELNGVTSEATGIYDPRNGVFDAWRTLFRQWELAFAIGAANARSGARVASFAELLSHIRAYRRRSRSLGG